MTLYLVQHGEAKAEAEDPEWPLTARGRDDIGCLAALLARTGVRVARLDHSGKRRAQETAELLAAAVAATPWREVASHRMTPSPRSLRRSAHSPRM